MVEPLAVCVVFADVLAANGLSRFASCAAHARYWSNGVVIVCVGVCGEGTSVVDEAPVPLRFGDPKMDAKKFCILVVFSEVLSEVGVAESVGFGVVEEAI